MRHGGGRCMEGEHVDLDALPHQLMNLVQHERLGQAGAHLGHVPNTPGGTGSLASARHPRSYSRTAAAPGRPPCWGGTMSILATSDHDRACPARSTAMLGVSAGGSLAHESHTGISITPDDG